MRNRNTLVLTAALTMTLALGFSGAASAQQLISNGGFETGLAGWTVTDQPGSSGTWFIQTGTLSPLNAFTVPAPPQGSFAAMTDQSGAGSHVLYQDFVVPVGVQLALVQFDRFVMNQAGVFFSPDTLDFSPSANQQARVDILTSTSDPFSVAGGDVLMNLFRTMPGDPATSGYTTVNADVTALLQAHEGQTLRLRFAEVDNQFFFQFGVDAVGLTVRVQDVPEPGGIAMSLMGGLAGIGVLLRRKSRA